MTSKTSIIISGPPAVGKTTLARGLSREFGLRYVSGGDILKELAGEQGFAVGGDDWWDTPEGMRFLKQRDENPEFDKTVDSRLVDMCRAGGVVITSYTLPWLVDNGGGGGDGDMITLWLDGSHANSARRMGNRDDMDTKEALEVTKKRYDRNKKLYKKLYGFEFGRDESVFDGVVNTDDLDVGGVLDAAIRLVKGRT